MIFAYADIIFAFIITRAAAVFDTFDAIVISFFATLFFISRYACCHAAELLRLILMPPCHYAHCCHYFAATPPPF